MAAQKYGQKKVSQHMQTSYNPEDVIPEDVVPTLQTLKELGYKLGLLTNRSRPVDEYLEEQGLISTWISGSTLGCWMSGSQTRKFSSTHWVWQEHSGKNGLYWGQDYADVVGAQNPEIRPY